MFGSSVNSNGMSETVASSFSCTRDERVALIPTATESIVLPQAAMLIVTDMVQANATQITRMNGSTYGKAAENGASGG